MVCGTRATRACSPQPVLQTPEPHVNILSIVNSRGRNNEASFRRFTKHKPWDESYFKGARSQVWIKNHVIRTPLGQTKFGHGLPKPEARTLPGACRAPLWQSPGQTPRLSPRKSHERRHRLPLSGGWGGGGPKFAMLQFDPGCPERVAISRCNFQLPEIPPPPTSNLSSPLCLPPLPDLHRFSLKALGWLYIRFPVCEPGFCCLCDVSFSRVLLSCCVLSVLLFCVVSCVLLVLLRASCCIGFETHRNAISRRPHPPPPAFKNATNNCLAIGPPQFLVGGGGVMRRRIALLSTECGPIPRKLRGTKPG